MAAEVVTLSERNSQCVLDRLEHPSAPNAKRRAAITKTHDRKAFDCGDAGLNDLIASGANTGGDRQRVIAWLDDPSSFT